MRVRAVVDHPLGLPGQCTENVEPPLVTLRDQLDERAENGQRFSVCLA
jgi:hypothetical protein